MKYSEVRALLVQFSREAPRQAATVLLRYIATEHGSRLAALLVPENDALSIFACIGFEQRALEWSIATWQRSARPLSEGFEVQDESDALVPIRLEGRLVALLYLHTPAVNMPVIVDVTPELAAATTCSNSAPIQHSIDEYLHVTPCEEVERRKLQILLKQFGGNKAQVARHLDVSRTTIYRRMEALGIRDDEPVK